MIKTKYFLLALWTLCSLGACIAPDNDDDNCQECREQQILLQLASDKATTRAGRPLTSNQPAQDVDRVALIICDATDNSIVTAKLVTDWMSNSTEYDTNNHRGRQDRVKLDEDERLETGTYKLYAIAYTYKETDTNNRTGYTVGTETTGLNEYFEALVKDHAGKTFTENFTLHLSNTPGEEIFAGSVASFTVTSAGFNVTIVLNRQVAGTYMYVKDIPYYDNLTKLRLVPATDNDGLVLGQFANEDIANNGAATKGLYVMNGTDANTSPTVQPLCEINLQDWFSNGSITKNENSNLISTDNWQQATDLPTGMKVEEGSFFAGNFVIPFAASTSGDEKSLSIQLVSEDEGNEKVEKEWTVKLPANDLNKQQGIVYYWDETNSKFENNKTITESVTNYSLLRNHLYCIGNKGMTDGTEDDEPQSLDNQQELLLQVIAEWDVVYDMVLEPGENENE